MLLISDLDGTAIDTTELILCSYEHVIEMFKLQKRTREQLRACTGTALRDLYAGWAQQPSDIELMFEAHRTFQTKILIL